MLSAPMTKALNEQIAREGQASDMYLAMAAWCEQSKLPGCANFFYAQADEERVHLLKLFRYVSSAGAAAVVPGRDAPPAKYKSILAAFEYALKKEEEVTAAINELIDLCLKQKDYGTELFLQWYVAEQQEEEGSFRAICDMIALVGPEGRGLYLIDNDIAARTGAAAAAAGDGGK